MDWDLHRKVVANAFKWMVAGMIGGVSFDLVSTFNSNTPVFWSFFVLIFGVGLCFSYVREILEPFDNSIQDDLEEIKSDLSDLKSEIPDSVPASEDETQEMDEQLQVDRND